MPVIGDTAAVAGSVSRPAIYELRGSTSVGELLAYAGGAVRPRGNSIAISRIAANGAEEFVRAATLSSRVVPGDALQLVGGSAGGATGRVTLYGNVQNPGPRPLSAAPTVRDLLGEVRDLRFDTYMPMAILIRRDPVTATRSFQPVNLMTALQGRPGVALRSDDRLYVFARSDIDFINRSPVRRIVLGQPNPLPDCASLNQLEALVRDTQSARFNVVTRGSFIVERGGQAGKELDLGAAELSIPIEVQHLEFAHGLAHAARELGQLVTAEQHQGDHHHQHELTATDGLDEGEGKDGHGHGSLHGAKPPGM